MEEKNKQEEEENAQEEAVDFKAYKKEHLRCSKCGSTNCYSLRDGVRVCRKCSFRE